MLVVRHPPDKVKTTEYGIVWGRVPLTFLWFLFYSFDTLVAVEYGDRWAFHQSFLNLMRNWNKHFKLADEPDVGRQEALCLGITT